MTAMTASARFTLTRFAKAGEMMKPNFRVRSALRWMMLLASLVPLTAAAQPYPSKPLRLIVPLAPGGPSDVLARTMGQQVTPWLGQTVVVDNRTGAGGTIGTDVVAKAPADGYTLLLIAMSTYTINASLYKKLPFDARKDLMPVTVLAAGPYMLVVHPSLPVRNLKQLIALAKARPNDLSYASGGAGTGPQLAMELLKLKAGMSITHIPYKGQGAAVIDLIAGHEQVGLLNMIGTVQIVQQGRLRAIAVSGPKQSAALPGIPTIEESGIPGFVEVAGHMIMVRSGTPPDIVARLNREFIKAVNTPEVKGRLESEGAEVIGNTPEQAAAIMRSDLDKWAEIIAKAGLKAD